MKSILILSIILVSSFSHGMDRRTTLFALCAVAVGAQLPASETRVLSVSDERLRSMGMQAVGNLIGELGGDQRGFQDDTWNALRSAERVNFSKQVGGVSLRGTLALKETGIDLERLVVVGKFDVKTWDEALAPIELPRNIPKQN